MSVGRWPKAIVLILAAGLLVAACGGSNNSGGAKTYKVGISNTLTGNGFREEMICSIKAQAKASGVVSKVITANRTTKPVLVNGTGCAFGGAFKLPDKRSLRLDKSYAGASVRGLSTHELITQLPPVTPELERLLRQQAKNHEISRFA